MFKKIVNVLDSTPFLIFFALWTGVYLFQVLQKQTSSPVNEVGWIVLGFIAGVVFL